MHVVSAQRRGTAAPTGRSLSLAASCTDLPSRTADNIPGRGFRHDSCRSRSGRVPRDLVAIHRGHRRRRRVGIFFGPDALEHDLARGDLFKGNG
jgi:hypothetical protein